jgi:hypothetical protein
MMDIDISNASKNSKRVENKSLPFAYRVITARVCSRDHNDEVANPREVSLRICSKTILAFKWSRVRT